ncbi:MAG: 8-oxo-dGTP diphosphatase [Erysipelotrichales bacterium]|nr:8-oxo-dGTP diphosphatase [Erysipelotrichales bacterium]
MSKVENVELTVLCLVTQGNHILLQNRVKRDWRGYTLPGGHVEKGESIVEAVIREMREETGLTILHPTLCGVKQFPIEEGRYIVFLFKCHEFTGDLVSSQEGEMVWVDREHLDEYTTVDDFMELLQVMESDDLTEFMYVVENEEWKVVLK